MAACCGATAAAGVVGAANGASVGAAADGAAASSSAVGAPLPHLRDCVYLDYNATTPIFPEVRDAMRPFTFELFGNPSSGHAYGRQTAAAVADARAAVAALVNAEHPDEIKFVGCGTEADNWAIWGTVMAARQRWLGDGGGGSGDGAGGGADGNGGSAEEGAALPPLPHVVTGAIEHPAVLACLEALARARLLEYTAVGAGADGRVSAEAVRAAIRPGRTVLVTVMHSHNEVGSLNPIAEIAAAARAAGALMHTDAAQSIGKVAVDVGALGVDLATIVGHKFGAPKGVAALYVRRGAALAPLLSGGGQEGGARAGTESVLLIAGLGAAADIARRELAAVSAHMAAAREALLEALLAGLPEGAARVNGPADPDQRLPNTLSISIRGLNAAALLAALSGKLAASAAAACHSGAAGGCGSPALAAMGVGAEWAAGTLRLSVGHHTTMDDVKRAAALILEEAARQGVVVAGGGRGGGGGEGNGGAGL